MALIEEDPEATTDPEAGEIRSGISGTEFDSFGSPIEESPELELVTTSYQPVARSDSDDVIVSEAGILGLGAAAVDEATGEAVISRATATAEQREAQREQERLNAPGRGPVLEGLNIDASEWFPDVPDPTDPSSYPVWVWVVGALVLLFLLRPYASIGASVT